MIILPRGFFVAGTTMRIFMVWEQDGTRRQHPFGCCPGHSMHAQTPCHAMKWKSLSRRYVRQLARYGLYLLKNTITQVVARWLNGHCAWLTRYVVFRVL